MDGEGTVASMSHRTNGSVGNSQLTNKGNTTNQNSRPPRTSNKNQQYQPAQQNGNASNYGEGAARKNPSNPRRGKKFNRNKGQGGQGQVQQGSQTQDSQEQATAPQQIHVTPRGPSWSNIVANQPVVDLNGYQVVPVQYSSQPSDRQSSPNHYQQTNENNAQKRHRTPKAQKRVAQDTPKEEETDYNADAKIEAIQIAVDKQLNDMQTRADRLKTLQEDIRKIKEERDVKIEELLNEKVGLTSRLQQLKVELQETENQISKIDLNVTQLKQEKVLKIRSLEEQSRALLDDKSN